MKRARKPLAIFFLGIFILQFVFLPEYFNVQQESTKNDHDLNQSIETPNSQYVPSYDNQSHRYIFLFNSSINSIDNATLFSFFNSTLIGGVITSDPWEYINGFSGIINNSESNLGAFIDQYNPETFQLSSENWKSR